MSIPLDDEQHELTMGSSFDPHRKVGFHSIRYDFKPASVDTSKEACVEVGARHQVTVTVPHIEGAGVPHTVFKGNKQPVMKECVLIIDHDKGTYTLEKLSSKINLKKTRFEGSSKAMQHISGRVTPVDTKKARSSTPTKTKTATKTSPEKEHVAPTSSDPLKGAALCEMEDVMPAPTTFVSKRNDGAKEASPVGEISDSDSSDSSDSSEEEMEDLMPAPTAFVSKRNDGPKRPAPSVSLPAPLPPPNSYGVLDNDLRLSESSSDSD